MHTKSPNPESQYHNQLRIHLEPPSAFLHHPLEITAHWVYALAFLALRQLEGNPYCTPSDLLGLPTWNSSTSISNIGKSVAGFTKSYPGLIEGTVITRKFWLHSSLSPEFTQDTEIIRRILEANRSPRPTEHLPSAFGQGMLSMGILHFERGRFTEAKTAFENALESHPSIEQKIETLVWLTRVQEFKSQSKGAPASIRQIKVLLEQHKQILSDAPRLEALCHIAQARIYLRQENHAEAEKHYLLAKTKLSAHHHREWGIVHNGLGRISQNNQQLERAFEHYTASVQFFAIAGWTWAQQASLNDCGVVLKMQSDVAKTNRKRQALLKKAAQYYTLCADICEAGDIGQDSACVEINIADLHRSNNNLTAAREWITRAINLAERAPNPRDQAMALLCLAEIEIDELNPKEAIRILEQAVQLLEQIELPETLKEAKARLERLRGRNRKESF